MASIRSIRARALERMRINKWFCLYRLEYVPSRFICVSSAIAKSNIKVHCVMFDEVTPIATGDRSDARKITNNARAITMEMIKKLHEHIDTPHEPVMFIWCGNCEAKMSARRMYWCDACAAAML